MHSDTPTKALRKAYLSGSIRNRFSN